MIEVMKELSQLAKEEDPYQQSDYDLDDEDLSGVRRRIRK